MYDIESIKKLLNQRLSQKRYIHSLNVADECRNLAKQYSEDEEKAYFAGLIHDICKELDTEELRQMAYQSGLMMTRAEKETKGLWHGVAGAAYIKDTLNITDADIINSVRFHTVARAGMSRLEEIVYMGDLISADRTYKDVKKMRRTAYIDLNQAMLDGLVFSIQSVIEKKGLIPEYTIQAYNQYLYIQSKCI
ncbi:MAG: bis(5'-nucleosyl)-tetraphosphatase (symmetrical) YqeK [Oscillospiraceae bacterium]|nr:bis(5'-nucleosyl)-tetraphosphatase (symmetrical) YqeK [Oscillospiraceae bacterium]